MLPSLPMKLSSMRTVAMRGAGVRYTVYLLATAPVFYTPAMRRSAVRRRTRLPDNIEIGIRNWLSAGEKNAAH